MTGRRLRLFARVMGEISLTFLSQMTPVNILGMLPWLDRYPLHREALNLRDGLDHGFWIPFTHSDETTMATNLKSAIKSEHVVAEKCRKELELGHMLGPFYFAPFHNLRASPLGVVPKKEEDKFGLITTFPILLALRLTTVSIKKYPGSNTPLSTKHLT